MELPFYLHDYFPAVAISLATYLAGLLATSVRAKSMNVKAQRKGVALLCLTFFLFNIFYDYILRHILDIVG